ncbi:hypothetical protein Tco_0620886 [Tanacetum coccineum]
MQRCCIFKRLVWGCDKHIDNFKNNQVVWESRQPDIPQQFSERPAQVFKGCARDPNAPSRYLFNKDLFFLINGNTNAKKYILSLHKIHATSFPEDDLEKLLKIWVRKVFTKFHVSARLFVHHWKNNQARMYYWHCVSKTRSDPDECFTNKKIIDIVRVRHHQVYEHEQIDEVVVRRNNDKFYSLAKLDSKYLNKNNIENIRNDTIEYKQQTTLIQALLIYIRRCVIWERVHDFQLGIESYQIKIKLPPPAITYLGIEKDPLYSIIDVPFVGIVYENSKKEKREMDIDELRKFIDATLKRVLRKISVINREAHGIIKISLSNKDKELKALLKEEIKERLKYRDQMQRYESLVNGRQITSYVVHPE